MRKVPSLCLLMTWSLFSASCSYYVWVGVLPGGTPSSQLDDSEVLKIVASVSEVVGTFGLKISPDMEVLDRLRASYREVEVMGTSLARFSTPQGQRSHIDVYVWKDRQTGSVEITIRSWDETEETPLVRGLREALTTKLVDEFGPDRVKVERGSSDMPLYMMP